MNATQTKDVGAILMITRMTFPKPLISFMIDAFNASAIALEVGAITITLTGAATSTDIDAALSFEENKSADVLIWHALSPADRAKFINFRIAAKLPDIETAAKVRFKKYQEIGALAITYLFHGSFAGLALDPPQVPGYALSCVTFPSTDLSLDKVCSVKHFSRAKFPGLVEDFFVNRTDFPDPMLSRVRLGFAGNRIFAIMKMIGTGFVMPAGANAATQLLLSKAVVDKAPFSSFHPDHPENPMRDCAKMVLAFIGDIMRAKGITVESLRTRNANLIIPGIAKALDTLPADASGSQPTLVQVRLATNDMFSWNK